MDRIHEVHLPREWLSKIQATNQNLIILWPEILVRRVKKQLRNREETGMGDWKNQRLDNARKTERPLTSSIREMERIRKTINIARKKIGSFRWWQLCPCKVGNEKIVFYGGRSKTAASRITEIQTKKGQKVAMHWIHEKSVWKSTKKSMKNHIAEKGFHSEKPQTTKSIKFYSDAPCDEKTSDAKSRSGAKNGKKFRKVASVASGTRWRETQREKKKNPLCFHWWDHLSISRMREFKKPKHQKI